LPDSGSNFKLYQTHAHQLIKLINLLHGFHCPHKHLQCNSVIKLYNEHTQSVQIQWPTCRSLGNYYTKVFIYIHSARVKSYQKSS